MRIATIAALLFAASCGSNVKGTYGEKVNAANAVSPDELAALLDTNESVPVVVSGTITSVCQSEGCWMTFKTTDGKMIYVNAKDKKFNLPATVAGRKATAQGEIWSVGKQQEQARQDGWSEEDVASIDNISVEATGIEIE